MSVGPIKRDVRKQQEGKVVTAILHCSACAHAGYPT